MTLHSRLAKLEDRTADAHQRETEEEIRARLAAVPDAVLFRGREPLESLVRRLPVLAVARGGVVELTSYGLACLDAHWTSPGDDPA
jgi:uncharacterized coiled-coil protein SlyX